MNNDTELSAYLEKMAPQVRHHGDGRTYMLQHKPGGQWVDLQVVTGTNLADLATRWWLTHRFSKVRAMPHTAIV